jgi:hypothetical protein
MFHPTTLRSLVAPRHRRLARPSALCCLIFSLVLLGCAAPSSAAQAPAEHLLESLSPRQSQQLRSALALAIEQVDRSSCKTLFQVLGQDGTLLLQNASFTVPDPESQRRVCNQNLAVLFTTVGGRKITVCQNSLAELARSELATLLIHEALHMAGVAENPPVHGAPTSAGLTRLVKRSCSG